MKTGSLTGSACKWGPKNSFWSPWGPTWEQWLSPPPQQPCPIPFSLSPCEPRLFWQNQLAELIFKKKKPRQNWSRDHFEATQKANFSILKPNFWSGDTAMGMAHWHNPKRVNFFSNILQNHYFVRWNSYFYQHFSGWLFCKFSNQDFLLFHNGIITLHCLGRWQIYRRGYFSFQNSSMTKNDSTVSIFSELTPQKSQFC